jgi:hypothetical protein
MSIFVAEVARLASVYKKNRQVPDTTLSVSQHDPGIVVLLFPDLNATIECNNDMVIIIQSDTNTHLPVARFPTDVQPNIINSVGDAIYRMPFQMMEWSFDSALDSPWNKVHVPGLAGLWIWNAILKARSTRS